MERTQFYKQTEEVVNEIKKELTDKVLPELKPDMDRIQGAKESLIHIQTKKNKQQKILAKEKQEQKMLEAAIQRKLGSGEDCQKERKALAEIRTLDGTTDISSIFDGAIKEANATISNANEALAQKTGRLMAINSEYSISSAYAEKIAGHFLEALLLFDAWKEASSGFVAEHSIYSQAGQIQTTPTKKMFESKVFESMGTHAADTLRKNFISWVPAMNQALHRLRSTYIPPKSPEVVKRETALANVKESIAKGRYKEVVGQAVSEYAFMNRTEVLKYVKKELGKNWPTDEPEIVKLVDAYFPATGEPTKKLPPRPVKLEHGGIAAVSPVEAQISRKNTDEVEAKVPDTAEKKQVVSVDPGTPDGDISVEVKGEVEDGKLTTENNHQPPEAVKPTKDSEAVMPLTHGTTLMTEKTEP